jgi:hypothetical protein
LCKNKDQPNNTKFIFWRTHPSIHAPSSSLPPIVVPIRVYITFGVIEKFAFNIRINLNMTFFSHITQFDEQEVNNNPLG